MSKKVRSAKGELVDFDLLKIKQQIAATPAASIVQEREMQIDRKLKRKVKKVEAPAPKVKVSPSPESHAEEKPLRKQKARLPDNTPITTENNTQEIHDASETDQ